MTTNKTTESIREPYDAMGPVDVPNPPTARATLADVQPGGRVRLGDADPMRSALEDALQFVETLHSTVSGDSRKIVWRCLERGRAALSAQPSPGGQAALDCIGRIEEAIEFRVPHDIYAAVHGELAELKAALAARQPVDSCTESECKRCRAHPDHRGSMEHAGISDFRQPVGDHLAQDRKMVSQPAASNKPSGNSGELAVDGARQPVGEPDFFMVRDEDESRWRESDEATFDSVKHHRPDDAIALYAAPPAQAVDLGQFRDAVELMEWQERGHANPDFPRGDSKKHAEALRLLALIDSHSAGGQP